jgi:hypothetical protein
VGSGKLTNVTANVPPTTIRMEGISIKAPMLPPAKIAAKTNPNAKIKPTTVERSTNHSPYNLD